MNVQFTPDQESYIRQAIDAGRLHSTDDAVKEAMGLWEERERRRADFLTSLDQAEAALARGEGTVISEASMKELAEDVSRRGRERRATEKHPQV